MRIKQPDSDNALKSLSQRLDSAGMQLDNCVGKGHDVIAVIYISTYTITPNVAFNGRKILDKIKRLANTSPNCICLVRTGSPSDFAPLPWLRKLQQQSINYLRSNCYTVHFSRKKEFTNHAKFLLCFHICFSEGIIHYGEYYGSTNLTQAGLGNTKKSGNYEEFIDSHRPKYSLTHSDISYLREIFDIVKHKSLIYTSRTYLAKNLAYHLGSLNTILNKAKNIGNRDFIKNDIGSLFDFYTDTERTYSQTLALLDDIPGKKITEPIIYRLLETRKPISPVELEMIISEPEFSRNVALDLNLTLESLREKIAENTALIRQTIELIDKKYEPFIESIDEYFDETEKDFIGYLRENSEKQASYMVKALNFKSSIG